MSGRALQAIDATINTLRAEILRLEEQIAGLEEARVSLGGRPSRRRKTAAAPKKARKTARKSAKKTAAKKAKKAPAKKESRKPGRPKTGVKGVPENVSEKMMSAWQQYRARKAAEKKPAETGGTTPA